MTTLLTNLKAYYKMEGNGTDSSGNGNDATLLNVSFSLANGLILQGAGFSGNGRFTKNSSSMLLGTNATSMAGWVKMINNLGDYPCPITLGSISGTNSAFAFFIDPSNNLNLGTYSFTITGIPINDGNWHFACATYDGATTVKYYVDNVLKGTQSATMNWLSNNIRIGYLDNNDDPFPDQNFIGNVDEVGYWQRALSATEITTLYNSGAGLTYPFGVSTGTNAGLLFDLL